MLSLIKKCQRTCPLKNTKICTCVYQFDIYCNSTKYLKCIEYQIKRLELNIKEGDVLINEFLGNKTA